MTLGALQPRLTQAHAGWQQEEAQSKGRLSPVCLLLPPGHQPRNTSRQRGEGERHGAAGGAEAGAGTLLPPEPGRGWGWPRSHRATGSSGGQDPGSSPCRARLPAGQQQDTLEGEESKRRRCWNIIRETGSHYQTERCLLLRKKEIKLVSFTQQQRGYTASQFLFPLSHLSQIIPLISSYYELF